MEQSSTAMLRDAPRRAETFCSAADEQEYLQLLIANQRLGQWIDVLRDPSQRNR
jgi:hypothetical protein